MINNKRLTVPNTLAVDITAAASASNGITQASNVQNNFGTSNMAIRFKGSVPDWTPAANVILHHKHDGTNGTILTLLTTGILRTTINGTNYDSTVATGMADGYVAVIDVDITRSSASAAGSIVYTLNGVILGASVAITATGDTTTELLSNGDFATDTVWTKGTGWTIAAGVASFTATGFSAGLSQPIAFVAGRVYTVTVTLTRVAGSVQLMRFEGGTAVGTTTVSASGTYTQYLTAVTGNVTFVINAGSTFTGTVDNISLKSILLTVDNASSLYVCGTSAVRSAAQWFSHRLFNRAKTVAENLSMFVNGMAAADVGGTQSPVSGNVLNGTSSRAFDAFTSGANNFFGTVPENSGTARIGCFSITTIAGNKYRMRATYSKNRVGAVLTAAIVLSRSSLTAQSNLVTFADISGEIDATLTATSSGDYVIGLYQTGTGTPGAMELTVTNIVIQKLGITSELLGANARNDTLTVTDSSGNAQNATLPAAGATVVLARK